MNEQELERKISELENKKAEVLEQYQISIKQQENLEQQWKHLCHETKVYNRRLHLLRTQQTKVRGYGTKWGHDRANKVYQ